MLVPAQTTQVWAAVGSQVPEEVAELLRVLVPFPRGWILAPVRLGDENGLEDTCGPCSLFSHFLSGCETSV